MKTAKQQATALRTITIEVSEQDYQDMKATLATGLGRPLVGVHRLIAEPSSERIPPSSNEASIPEPTPVFLSAICDRLFDDHGIGAGFDDVVGSIVIPKELGDRAWWFGTANGIEWTGDLVSVAGVTELTAIPTHIDAREINPLIISDGIASALAMWQHAGK